MIHKLKCWPDPFEATKAGLKRFEFRKNDRDYKVGDTLLLMKWDPRKLTSVDPKEFGYMGEEWNVRVTYILHGDPCGAFGIPPDYCIMSIGPVA